MGKAGNPWTVVARGRAISGEDEAQAAYEERIEAEAGVQECGACGAIAYYRSTIGSYQCPECRAVLSYSGEWR